jgi:hypothetical protein
MSNTLPERRREGRQRVLMTVRCRIAPGRSPEVGLTELSLGGCRILLREGLVTPGQHVVIKAKALEGLPGTVRWVMGDAAGIIFEQPLHPAVLEHLLQDGALPSAYRSAEFIDHSGQRVPREPRTTGHPLGRRSCL